MRYDELGHEESKYGGVGHEGKRHSTTYRDVRNRSIKGRDT